MTAGVLLVVAMADPTAGERVLAFAKEKVGEQVGDGECATLVVQALRAAGAKPFGTYKDAPDKGDYVWGRYVYTTGVKDGERYEKKAADRGKPAPGDVVQFRDAKFEGRTPGGGTYTAAAPHHTAVVAKVSADGKTWTLLHQNWNGNRTVAEWELKPADLKSGWLRVYRPEPK